MTKQTVHSLAGYEKPLDMNGLSGRMVHLPAPRGKTAEILFVYGQHSSLERWWGLMQYLHRFAAVTAPDLPGFGGMESFYKIDKKPTLDNYADYLASFIKLRYKRKKLTIIGVSLGFVIATRMLQRSPELRDKVSLLVSLGGFTHRNDFRLSAKRLAWYRMVGLACSMQLPALLVRYVSLSGALMWRGYHRTSFGRQKLLTMKDAAARTTVMRAEIDLWHLNDLRTHAYTLGEMLGLNNCRERLGVPVWHVGVVGDHSLNENTVEQHLQVAFKDCTIVTANTTGPAPSVITDDVAASTFIPRKLRRKLASL